MTYLLPALWGMQMHAYKYMGSYRTLDRVAHPFDRQPLTHKRRTEVGATRRPAVCCKTSVLSRMCRSCPWSYGWSWYRDGRTHTVRPSCRVAHASGGEVHVRARPRGRQAEHPPARRVSPCGHT